MSSFRIHLNGVACKSEAPFPRQRVKANRCQHRDDWRSEFSVHSRFRDHWFT